MAESTDTNEYVLLTGVRPGFKREFAFALKSHSQCSSLGYTRLRRKRGLIESSTSTNMFGVGDKTDDDNLEFSGSKSIILCQKKMPKIINLNRFPTKLKELLETRLLEDFPVRYLRGPKTRGPNDIGLQGVIKGSGILCSCDICGGAQVVTPNQFELHANSGNKRPSDYIYLENGKALRQVLDACKDATMESLETTIRNAIGCSSENKSTFCMKCKGPIQEAGTSRTMPLCNLCMNLKESQPNPTSLSDNHDRSPTTISIPKSSTNISCISSQSKTRARLTLKNMQLHKLVFHDDVLRDGDFLAYCDRIADELKVILPGYKKGDGIYCSCCSAEVSASQFEAHAGCGSRRKLYLHIYMSNEKSLHQFALELSESQEIPIEDTDDLCSICADGGDLLCCDNCPRAFHTECVSLPCVPGGTWYCRYCQNMFQKQKSMAARRIGGIDPTEHTIMQRIHVAGNAESVPGGCALCNVDDASRGHDFSKSRFGPRTIILCDQCEKEYHVGCLKEHEMDDVKKLPKGKWFCCMDCNRIHSELEKLVIRGEQTLPECLTHIVKKKLKANGSKSSANLDMSWRLLRGKMGSRARTMLREAIHIFSNGFGMIEDLNSGCDLIPEMVYGRKLNNQEFGGCIVLYYWPKEVAELPLAATKIDYQGQGYFQVLFSCIKNLLRTLKVRNLVLQSVDNTKSLWTNRFGFKKIDAKRLKKFERYYNIMNFEGTTVLQKIILEP